MKIEEQIGRRIRQARRSMMPDMSIERLAELSGLSRQTVSAIENGKTKNVAFVNIYKIAQALKLKLDELAGASGNLVEQVAEEHAMYGARKGDASSHAQARDTHRKGQRLAHPRRRAG